MAKVGRKPGSRNKLTRAAVAAAAATGELPHEFLLRVSRGEPFVEAHCIKTKAEDGSVRDEWMGRTRRPTADERISAATSAAPYYAPKLASIEHKGDGGGPIRVMLSGQDADL